MSHDDNLEAIVDQLIDGCVEVIEKMMGEVDCPATQNAAVSALGMSIASSTLRSVTDETAAKKIAADLCITFATECAMVIAEVWGGREDPQ